MIPRIQGGGRADSLRKIDTFVSSLPPRVDMHTELGVDILLNVFSGFEVSGPYAPFPSDREYEALQLAQVHAALSEPSKASWYTKMARLDAALIEKPAHLSNKRDSLHAVYGRGVRSRKQSVRRQGTQRNLLTTMGGSSKMDLKALAAAEVQTRLTELFDLSAGASNAVLDRHKCHVMSICIAKQMGATSQRKSRTKASMAWTPEAVENLLFAGDDTIDARRFCDRFLQATETVTAFSTNHDHIAFIDTIYTDVASEIETASLLEKTVVPLTASSPSPKHHEPKRAVLLLKGGPVKPRGIGKASPRKAAHVVQEILAPTTKATMTARQPTSRPVADKLEDERPASLVLQDRLEALQENRRSIFQANATKHAPVRLMSKVKPHPPTLDDDDVDLQECKVMTFSFGKLKLGHNS
ncbi:hypothetical protein SPRG_07817 [Saprolegnia parasitica CBS 223.65]|uniref:Uncharacterized protein n=1 Tax=Saprolegnia parasitica (strain CBS 223.65) TaxID=695850 RepID=A0A067CKL3_SAPPC|nr:hypothetical protein SPRG_07817 [Saprolegnia parasitica CBS 223.65]KDO27106.1 hypothetical protein SPRG_07817 [Saprolegnia parasitica CBS 223.65]|eukprot:XP_012202199.1 hypothetical protein SPRG_07817 [Saprolegnia parasitica CBS 223.65]